MLTGLYTVSRDVRGASPMPRGSGQRDQTTDRPQLQRHVHSAGNCGTSGFPQDGHARCLRWTTSSPPSMKLAGAAGPCSPSSASGSPARQSARIDLVASCFGRSSLWASQPGRRARSCRPTGCGRGRGGTVQVEGWIATGCSGQGRQSTGRRRRRLGRRSRCRLGRRSGDRAGGYRCVGGVGVSAAADMPGADADAGQQIG